MIDLAKLHKIQQISIGYPSTIFFLQRLTVLFLLHTYIRYWHKLIYHTKRKAFTINIISNLLSEIQTLNNLIIKVL